jgi:hypothetical protein
MTRRRRRRSGEGGEAKEEEESMPTILALLPPLHLTGRCQTGATIRERGII